MITFMYTSFLAPCSYIFGLKTQQIIINFKDVIYFFGSVTHKNSISIALAVDLYSQISNHNDLLLNIILYSMGVVILSFMNC
jgi:hypothetical protein